MKITPSIKIIGIGNPFRSDDGIGHYITKQLRKYKLPNVDIIEECGEGTLLMERWNGGKCVIVVDAVSSGSTPGTIHRFDIHTDRIPSNFFHYSSHTFGLAEAIELSQVLGRVPENLIVYGVECNKFDDGEGISEELKNSVGTIIHDIKRDVRSFRKQTISVEKDTAESHN
jgi:hydrogenase maturation protease